jgi:phosphoenolpyruvate carboxykinase (ATP)
MNLPLTRALVRAALSGALNDVQYVPNPGFRCLVPEACPGVERRLLDPRSRWCDGAAYERAAGYLAARMAQNAERFTAVRA